MLTANWITANPRIQPIGLDLGHSSLKMVQLAVRDGKVKVLAARQVPVEGDGRERDSAVIGAIQQLLADGQFRGREVVSALPIDKVRITSLRLPEDETDQADKILRREAAERFDLDPARDAIDYILAGSVRQGDEVKNEYILFAVDYATVEGHIRLLEEAGLTPAAVDASPCALFRAFERFSAPPGGPGANDHLHRYWIPVHDRSFRPGRGNLLRQADRPGHEPVQ